MAGGAMLGLLYDAVDNVASFVTFSSPSTRC